MTTTLSPYLNFRGNAREAMEFYREVLGGELYISTFKQFGAAADPSEDDLVMHADLHGAGGLHLLASDAPPRIEMREGSNFALSLVGDSEPELRAAFDRLAAGGTVSTPLAVAAWGAVFGMCTDRFGVRWLVNIDPRGAGGQ